MPSTKRSKVVPVVAAAELDLNSASESSVEAPATAVEAPNMATKRKYKKQKIPKALRETLWLTKIGKAFEAKCSTPWCQNRMTVYDFQAGHCVPEAKGGATVLENLVPICSRCNLSMGHTYTFEEWSKFLGEPRRTWSQWLRGILCCFGSTNPAAQQPLSQVPPSKTSKQ